MKYKDFVAEVRSSAELPTEQALHALYSAPPLGATVDQDRMVVTGIDEPYFPPIVGLLYADLSKDARKFLYFGRFVDEVRILHDALNILGIPCARYDGDMSSTDRADALDRFRQGGARGLILTSQSGAEGLNLQMAEVAYIFHPDYNPAVQVQAIGRMVRMGSSSAHKVVKLIVDQRSDGRVSMYKREKLAIQSNKMTLTDCIVPLAHAPYKKSVHSVSATSDSSFAEGQPRMIFGGPAQSHRDPGDGDGDDNGNGNGQGCREWDEAKTTQTETVSFRIPNLPKRQRSGDVRSNPRETDEVTSPRRSNGPRAAVVESASHSKKSQQSQVLLPRSSSSSAMETSRIITIKVPEALRTQLVAAATPPKPPEPPVVVHRAAKFRNHFTAADLGWE
jgi:superfamily II DNA/RNA helicase